MTARRQVSLPEDLCSAAEKQYGGRFESLESLLEFVLREIVQNDAARVDQSEREMIEKRLRDLGYM